MRSDRREQVNRYLAKGLGERSVIVRVMCRELKCTLRSGNFKEAVPYIKVDNLVCVCVRVSRRLAPDVRTPCASQTWLLFADEAVEAAAVVKGLPACPSRRKLGAEGPEGAP